tara:strand:- start:239 stop:433 length:195 start_codon:yes stop_codon:yes gene_type:complete
MKMLNMYFENLLRQHGPRAVKDSIWESYTDLINSGYNEEEAIETLSRCSTYPEVTIVKVLNEYL